VVIAGCGNIAAAAERERVIAEIFALKDVPISGARTPERDVGLAVAGEIGRDRLVIRQTELSREQARGRTLDPPLSAACKRTEDRDIGKPVAVIITDLRNIARCAEDLRRHAAVR